MQQKERDWDVLLYSLFTLTHTDIDLYAICFTLTSKERFGVWPYVRMKNYRGREEENYSLRCVDIR